MVAEPKPKPPRWYGQKENVHLSNEDLLDKFVHFGKAQKELADEMGHIEAILHKRMVDNKTKTIDHDEVTCQMGTATTYPDMLMSLRETVGEERWTKGFTPAHQETKVVDVPDKFDMRVVNGWKSLGNHVTDVIDHATDPYSAKLTLRLKKQSTEEVTA